EVEIARPCQGLTPALVRHLRSPPIPPPPSDPSSRDRPFPATTPPECAQTSPEALWSTTCERADDRGATDSDHPNRPCRSSRPRTSVPGLSPLPCRRGAASPRSAPLSPRIARSCRGR